MKKLCACILMAVVSLSAVGCARVYADSATVFGSDIVFSARLYGPGADKAYKEMLAVMEALAVSADTTVPDSVIARVNAAPVGERVETDEIFHTLTQSAVELYEETDGAFNVFLAPLSRLWSVDAETVHKYVPNILNPAGFHPDKLPAPEDVQALLATANPYSFELSEEDGRYYVTKTAPVEFDFGGLAKGWAVDRCREIAADRGIHSAMLNLSGNLYLVNRSYDDKSGAYSDWTVFVTDPRPRPDALFSGGYVMAFASAGNESIVTSGDYERYYYYPYGETQVRVPHIIGKSGLPVGLQYNYNGERYVETNHVISATVTGPSSMLCDAYATAISVMGLEAGAAFLADKPDYKALIFTSDGSMKRVGAFTPYQPDKYDRFLTQYEEV